MIGRAPLLSDRGEAMENIPPETALGLTPYPSLDEALDARPDIVIVANPTALHAETAAQALARGLNVFVEKPLATTEADVDKLEALARTNGGCCYVGYQRRFHPGVRRARRLVASGALGTIVGGAFDVASFVPAWRPWMDYHDLYAVRRDLGGGVIFTESHEIDQCYRLFGMPNRIAAAGGRLVAQDIDVEDTAVLLLAFEPEGTRGLTLPVTISLCFFAPRPFRRWTIRGTAGSVTWVEHRHELRYDDYASGRRHRYLVRAIDPTMLYVAQARHYLHWLSSRRRDSTGIPAAGAAVRIACASHRALQSGLFERIDYSSRAVG